MTRLDLPAKLVEIVSFWGGKTIGKGGKFSLFTVFYPYRIIFPPQRRSYAALAKKG